MSISIKPLLINTTLSKRCIAMRLSAMSLSAMFLLMGCGQKGALYMPAPTEQTNVGQVISEQPITQNIDTPPILSPDSNRTSQGQLDSANDY